jgi:signal transduction histidine kinase
MKPSSSDTSAIGPRLTLAFVVLILLIAVGNGLVLWQFQSARLQTNRLTSAQQQLSAAFQLQVNLLSFHQTLRDLSESTNARRLSAETAALRKTLSDEGLHIKTALARLPASTPVDPALLPLVESIQATLPAQLEAINALAMSDDWATIQRRLRSELPPLELQTSELVVRIDQRAREELAQAQARMRRVQNTVLIIVPATAIGSFVVAAILGWSVVRRIVELRLETRVSERTRIARDLHDTLLQSFQGVLLRFQAAVIVLPDRPTEAKQVLEHAIDEAADAITEGRDAVHNLRLASGAADDLAVAIGSLGRELTMSPDGTTAPAAVDVSVEGTARNLHPLVRDEVYRIAGEAVRNAFRHANAQRIEVEIRYDDRRLRVRVRDDGRGIQPAVLEGDRPGHFGLPGMRERAEIIGGRLTVWSEGGLGTEIELTIPAGAAYVRSRPRSALFAGRTGAYL